MEAAGIEPSDGFYVTADPAKTSVDRQHNGAANVLQAGGASGHEPASTDATWHFRGQNLPAAVVRIATAWPRLAPHIREAIVTLVDASFARLPEEAGGKPLAVE